MRFLIRHNRHHKVSQSVPHFMFRKTVTTFLRIKVGGHFVMSFVKCYESHYVGVLDNPPPTTSVLCAPLLLLLSGQSNRPVRFRNIPWRRTSANSLFDLFFNPNAFLLSLYNLKVEVVSQITWRFSFLGGRPFFTVFISLLTRTQHPNNAKNTIFKH